MNCDAAIDKNKGLTGFGVIARYNEGNVLAAKCSSKSICFEPVMAESWAGFQAVMFCKEIDLFDIVLEGDALQVVKEINSDNPTLSKHGHFIDGIKSELGFLRSYSVIHVRREANYATHTLAKSVVTQVIDVTWLEEIPPSIYDVVCREFVIPLS